MTARRRAPAASERRVAASRCRRLGLVAVVEVERDAPVADGPRAEHLARVVARIAREQPPRDQVHRVRVEVRAELLDGFGDAAAREARANGRAAADHDGEVLLRGQLGEAAHAGDAGGDADS